MPIGRSAKKSLRKSSKNRKANNSFKSKLKLLVKEFLKTPSEKAAGAVQSGLDKAVKRGILHKNKVARLKSQYAKKIKVVAKSKTAKEKMSK